MLENLVLISLLASFLLTIVLFVVNFKEIKKQFSGIRKTTWIVLLIVFIFGFYLMATSPSLFFTLHDETGFLMQARDISQGNFRIDKHIGYPVIMAVVFFFFGANLSTAYIINMVLGSFSIILMFFVGYLFFEREDAGLYSSILLSLLIPHIITARSMESNVSSLFALLAALSCFLLYFKIRSFKSQLLAALSLSFAVYFRFEFVLLIFIFILMILLFEKNLKGKIRNYKWWIPWVVSIVLTAPWILFTIQNMLLPLGQNPFVYDKTMGVFSLEYVMINNIGLTELLFINSNYFPSFMTFFLLLGPLSLVRKCSKKLFFLLAIFTVFTLLYLSYAVPTDRHFLISYVIMILFWAKGISFLAQYLQNIMERFLKTWKTWISLGIFLVFSLLIFASFLPYVFSFQEDPLRFPSGIGIFWEEREVYLEREAVYFLNKNLTECDIAAVDVEFLVFENLNPVRIDYLLDNPERANESDGCLLFFEDLYCEEPLIFYGEEMAEKYRSLCDQMHEKFNLTVYRKFNVTLPETFKNFKPKFIQRDWANFTLYNISST